MQRRRTTETYLLVGELEAELLDTALDGVPAGEAVADRDVAGEAEVLGLEDLVGRGVVEDGLGVDAGLVSERAVATVYEVSIPISTHRRSIDRLT